MTKDGKLTEMFILPEISLKQQRSIINAATQWQAKQVRKHPGENGSEAQHPVSLPPIRPSTPYLLAKNITATFPKQSLLHSSSPIMRIQQPKSGL